MKLPRIGPFPTLALGGLVLVTSLSIGSGCAQSREVVQRMGAPAGADDADELAYDRGHHIGRRDAERERPADYTLHPKEYDAATEKAFASGFRDGFSGSPNRYGSPDTRDWLYGRDGDPDRQR